MQLADCKPGGQRTSTSLVTLFVMQERASHIDKVQKAQERAAAELRQALAGKESEVQRCAGALAKLEAELRAERQKAAAAEARLAAEQRYSNLYINQPIWCYLPQRTHQ